MHTTSKWIKLKEVKSFNIFKFLKLLRIEYTNCIVCGLHLFENFVVKRSFSIYNKLEKLKRLFIKLLLWFNIRKKRLIKKKNFYIIIQSSIVIILIIFYLNFETIWFVLNYQKIITFPYQ